MKTILSVFIFLFAIAGLLTMYLNTSNQLIPSNKTIPLCVNGQNSTTTNPCNVPVNIGVNQAQNQQQNSQSGNVNNGPITTFSCPAGFIGVGCQFVCFVLPPPLGGPNSSQCRSWQIATIAGGSLTGNPLTGQSTISISNTLNSATNNFLYLLTNNPLATAIAVGTTFVLLGIAAGAFGAGIKADVMGSVGIALSVVTYVQVSLIKLNDIPTVIFLMFAAIEVPCLIFIIDESLSGGKGP